MEVATLSANTDAEKELAKAKYKEYLEAVKARKSQEYNALRRAYRALSKGYKVIDIYKAFEDTGLGADGRPKIAIIRADAKLAYFSKERGGGGRFSINAPSWNRRNTKDDVALPAGVFSDWPTGAGAWDIKDPNASTNVPIIPAHITIPGKLENYYILFEVDKWSTFTATKDPFLLQRLSENTFVVLAEWDVSEVEAVVMRGAAQGAA